MLKLPESRQEPKAAKGPLAKVKGRLLRRFGFGLLALTLAVVAIGGVLAWQASQASIDLDFLRGRMEKALLSRLPAEASLSIGSTAFSYRGDQGLILKARDVRLDLPGIAGGEIAELATVATPSALLGGRVDLNSVTVSGAAITVAVPPRPLPEGSIADIVRYVAELAAGQVLRTDAMIREAGLEEVVLRDTALRVIDKTGTPGPALMISEAAWQPAGEDRSQLSLQVVERSGAGWELTLERAALDDGGAAVSLAVEDLPLSALATALADAAEEDAYYEAAVTLQARMEANADGSFRQLGGVVSTGAGPLSVSGVDRIDVDEAALNFALGSGGDSVAIPSGEIRSRKGNLQFEGAVDLSQTDQATLVARVNGGGLPTIGSDGPVPLAGGGLLAHLDFTARKLNMEGFQLSTEEGSFSAVGEMVFSGASAGLSLSLSLSEMPARVARAFWPPFVAEKTRRWFDANVKSGRLGPATLQIALPDDHLGKKARDRVLPHDGLVGWLPFEDATFSPFASFPVIEEASGYVEFGDATATALAQTGIIAMPGKGDLKVDGTILVVPELGGPEPTGDLHLQLAGPASALAALSNSPPFSIAARRGIKPEALSGEAQLLLNGRVPLHAGGFQELSPTFRLSLAEFTSTEPIDNRLIAEADLVLEGNARSYTVRGEGTLDGLEASVDLIMGTAAPDHTDVTVALDDAARERLGLSFGRLLTGPVQASIKQVEGGVSQQIALDLKEARIGVAALGWEKGPGVPATATFVMEKTAEGTRILDLVIAGQGFGVEGEVSLDPEGRVSSADLEKFALRPGDDLSLTATRGEGAYDVSVRGDALDARGIIAAVGSGLAGGGDTEPLRISLNIGSVTGQNGVVLSNVAGSLRITSNGLDAASLKGSARRQPFEWTLGRQSGQRVVSLRANDGGALIRFAGIYTKVTDGSLVLDYRGPIGGTGSGVAVMRDFRLVDETALAPAVETARRAASRAGAAHSGAVRAVDLQSSGDLYFSQLTVPFRQNDWIIAIDDAALRGPMLGATASGTINIPGKQMAISGTFIPAFGLNNIAGSIPIIGTILGGGRDEGLVGITFKFFGSINNPTLAMNPISAIAPGIFRKIFEYR